MTRGLPDGFNGARRIGKQQIWMAMLSPEFPEADKCEVRKRNQPVLVALAPADMNQSPPGINISHLERQGLAKTKSHGVCGQKKDPVPQFFGGSDEHFYFGWREYVRNGLHLGRLYDVDPLPVFFEDEFPEMLKPEPVSLDRA